MATVNWNEPTVNTLYNEVLPDLHNKILSCATLFNSGNTVTNIPNNAIKLGLSGSNFVFQKYYNSAWENITTTFDMSVTKLNAQLPSYYLNCSNFTGILPAASFNSTTHGVQNAVDGGGTALHTLATTTSHGMMSSTDKALLDGLVAGTVTPTYIVDSYHTEVDLATEAELAAGTVTDTRRLSPFLIAKGVASNLKKAPCVVFNSFYNIGTVSGSKNIDVYDGQYQILTLGGNTTLTITPYSNQPYTMYLHVQQDATGGRVLVLPSGKWENGVAKSITPTANSLNLLTIHWTGSSYIYMLLVDIK